ncbi:MAG: hypothetical protein EP297_12225 [Gammaproteobacteria bacterium]|nr:MAG: hypothetical protein EP297_12225 [Gammaproteobacteria bacterium]
MKLGRINTCIQSLIFASVLAVPAAPAHAFDPMGLIVNMIMEEILFGDHSEPPQGATTAPLRNIPGETLTGTMYPPNGRYVKIDNKQYELAFSSRIRDEYNRIVQPGTIQQEKEVRYSLNAQQQIEKVWLLTPGEE